MDPVHGISAFSHTHNECRYGALVLIGAQLSRVKSPPDAMGGWAQSTGVMAGLSGPGGGVTSNHMNSSHQM